jgi:hypothetical protein
MLHLIHTEPLHCMMIGWQVAWWRRARDPWLPPPRRWSRSAGTEETPRPAIYSFKHSPNFGASLPQSTLPISFPQKWSNSITSFLTHISVRKVNFTAVAGCCVLNEVSLNIITGIINPIYFKTLGQNWRLKLCRDRLGWDCRGLRPGILDVVHVSG